MLPMEVVGVNSSVSFVVLAATNITIERFLICLLLVTGFTNETLVDSLVESYKKMMFQSAVKLFFVDGSPVSTTFCDDATGAFSLEYVMPISVLLVYTLQKCDLKEAKIGSIRLVLVLNLMNIS